MHFHSSKVWLFFSLLIVVVLALGACAQPAAPAAPAEGEGGGEEAAAMSDLPDDAAAEQVLRINTGSTGSSSFHFYPMEGGSDNQSWMPLLHTPPLYFDVDLNLQPGVFDSWESNDDFTEWVFTIDPRAQFSDGSPITAADVKATWELMTDPLTEQQRIQGYIGNVVGFDTVREQPTADMEGLTVVDDSTLQVNLVNADPVFHWRIATTHMHPLKVDEARENLDTFWRPENNPVFSGPYMLDSFDPDLLEATMIPNPNWWMDEGPYLDRIEFRFQPEPETLAVMLQNDQVDASLGALPQALKEQFPDYFRPTKNFGFNTYWVNGVNDPTTDINVRKALVHAVDMEAIFKAGYPQGGAIMATQIIDPDLPCLSENSWYEYNPEMAQEFLAASEYGSAENLPKLRITPRGTYAPLNRQLEAVMEFWRQNLGISNIEFQVRPDGFGQDEEKINLSRDDAVIRFPDSATYMWTAAHSAGPIASGDMLRGYSNPEIDALLEEALLLPVEDPQRCELTLQAQELFMAGYPAIFPGIDITTINARDYVAGYEKGPDVGLIAPWRIYLKEH